VLTSQPPFLSMLITDTASSRRYWNPYIEPKSDVQYSVMVPVCWLPGRCHGLPTFGHTFNEDPAFTACIDSVDWNAACH
jgi:hypothetical protein